MHEFSVVQSLITLTERYAKENDAKRITKIVVVVGVLSGIEPHLLELAFEAFKEGTIAEKAELAIEVEKLKLQCEDCLVESEKEELNITCPVCGSLNTRIKGGQELLLKSLEMECPDEA
ncbi:MAG: hydrogenase maturation nickel metallochaperone HypA [Aquificaceae bacterium]